jgi:hypothetical protein
LQRTGAGTGRTVTDVDARQIFVNAIAAFAVHNEEKWIVNAVRRYAHAHAA